MNIRVDLTTPIQDGTEVVFRSPVDCSQITGLIVYHNGESKEFAFADAHGNNVGDIDHLFAENAVVKVILDVSTSMAFVQNADTNAYLEWRFQDTIDKCCPTFTESGAIVTCEPVEGYPLTVTAEEGATTITRCGKNLLSDDWKNLDKYTYYSDNKKYLSLNLRPGTYRISAVRKEGAENVEVWLYLRNTIDNGATWLSTPYVEQGKKTNAVVFEVKGDVGEEWVLWTNASYIALLESVQIELGTVATDHEQYHGETFSVLETVPALQGVNHIFADVGEVTVTGKADPTAIIENLTKAIASLGGNV